MVNWRDQDGSALNREDITSQLEQLILASQLPVDDLHGLLDQAWARTHSHETAAKARPALVELLGRHKPEELDTVDSLLRTHRGREDELVARLTKELAQQAATPPKVVKAKYIIVGAGPAGLQLGYFMDRASRDYLILEKTAAPGASFKLYPRHRQLISINKRFGTGLSTCIVFSHRTVLLLALCVLTSACGGTNSGRHFRGIPHAPRLELSAL